MPKKSRKKLKYLENEKSFQDVIKSTFHHFSRAIIEANNNKKFWRVRVRLEQLITLLYRKQCLYKNQRKTLWLCFVYPKKGRTSRSQMFFKIDVLKIFANFTGKRLKTCSFIKKRLQHKCFPVKFRNILRAPFFRTPPIAASGRDRRRN